MEKQLSIGAEVANSVMTYLGGNAFLAITGTKPKFYDDNNRSVMFGLTRNQIGAKFMEVRLNSMDTYDVLFFKLKDRTSVDRVILHEAKGYYGDMLQELFTNVTGLNTRL